MADYQQLTRSGPVRRSFIALIAASFAVAGALVPVAPAHAATGLQNPTLEEVVDLTTGLPQCYQVGYWGTPTYTNTTTTAAADAHSGTRAVAITVSAITAGAGAVSLVTSQDSGICAPAVTPGEVLTLGAWYNSTVATEFAVYYYMQATGTWEWSAGLSLPVTTAYTQATLPNLVVPAGATLVSFGLSMVNTGTVTVDDFSMVRSAGKPGAPLNVSASAADGSATVKWDVPASDGGSAITGYKVTAAPGGSSCAPQGTATSCTIPGLTNGTPYTFTVTATNAIGEGTASASSAPATPAIPPGAPTGVKAVAGNGSATVSWSAPATTGGSAILGYTVTSSPGGKTCATAGMACTIPGLTNGTTYTFTARATNAAGPGAVSLASAPVKPAAPATVIPVRVKAAKAGFGNVLSVNVDPDRRTGSTVFRVERRNSNGTWSSVGSFQTTGTTQTRSITLGAGIFRVAVPAAGGYGAATSNAVTLTAPVVKVSLGTNSSRSKLYVNVDPDKGSGYWKFKVQKRNANGTWSTLSTTYKTSGSKETKTVNKGKGTYRVVVTGKYGYLGAASAAASLRK